jgi:HSP20 family molecular chaperone IbpA
MASSLWKFTREDGLVCINYPREKDRNGDDEDNDVTDLTDNVQDAVTNELGDDFDRIGDHTRQFNASNFSKVDVSGAFVVRFRKGETYKVVADGREKDLEDINVKVDGNELIVSLDGKGLFKWGNRKRIGLTITIPKAIDELKLSGASKANLTEFENYDDLSISMSGACRTVFDGRVNKLSLDMSGASNTVLRGHANQFDADLSGACKVEATSMNIEKASVDASGASHVNLGQVRSLDSETSGASKVTRQ